MKTEGVEKPGEACLVIRKTSDGGLFVICPRCKGENLFSAQRVAHSANNPLRCWKCGELLRVEGKDS